MLIEKENAPAPATTYVTVKLVELPAEIDDAGCDVTVALDTLLVKLTTTRFGAPVKFSAAVPVFAIVYVTVCDVPGMNVPSVSLAPLEIGEAPRETSISGAGGGAAVPPIVHV